MQTFAALLALLPVFYCFNVKVHQDARLTNLEHKRPHSYYTPKPTVKKIEELERQFKVTLPDYKYCGYGVPLEKQLKNWRKNPPVNKLDLFCFYHLLFYASPFTTAKKVRKWDVGLIEDALEFNDEVKIAKINFKEKAKLKTDVTLVVNAMKAKIKLEDMGVINGMELVGDDPEKAQRIYDLVDGVSLPEIWGLPFYVPRCCHQFFLSHLKI
eukprot:TRINITY_DN127087_c0_g1_i1.p2 TRINITY_DN127087_c0_g1~~TRINITY_DN127087_c0_g1_i1.p2  ORF type:complete len:212 (-),score=26.29 TRINITY_DN127087_c0_g1_i1:185-820(-)